MAITYPLSVPAAPGFRQLNFTATNLIGSSSSPFTASVQTVEWPGEFLALDCGLPEMDRDDAEAWVAFLLSLRGMLGTFHIGDDSNTAPRGVATITGADALINGAQNAASKTLATKGWTHNVTGILKAGDWIQIGTGDHQRLHKVLVDANSDSSGHATLDIFPKLREGVSDNQVITLINCKGTFRLADNSRSWSIDEAMLYGIDFKCMEAL
jgi:hypothetical protein